MKTGMFLLFLLLCSPLLGQVEETNSDWMGRERTIGIHTNVLYWGAMTPNLGVEIPLARQWSVDVMGFYAHWDFKQSKKYRVAGVQPELRWWCCQAMTRHYVGVHFHYAVFNIGEEMFRRDGWLMGGGLSYGYVWVVTPRWNIDFSLGLGYARIEYDKYAQKCNLNLGERCKNYWGPTKMAVTFTYKIPY